MPEREWREASDMRTSTVLLALVLVCGALLRFWALGSGIPFAVQVDEPEVMDRAVHMMKTGDFNPHFFDYPGLYIYLQMLVATLRFLTGAMAGLWRSLDQVGPADFYLWGRAVTALLGTLTILLVYQVGMRWGARHALLAAGLTAVMPMHVRESHFVLTDVPMTFFATLTFLFALRAQEGENAKAFALAGAAAGLAAATKYNGGLTLLMPLIAAWMTLDAKPSRLACALASIAGAAVAFLVAAPYTVLDLPAFLNGFADLVGHFQRRTAGTEPGWVLYLKYLRNGMGWPALLLAGAGLALGIVRAGKGPGGGRWALLVTFPLAYFYLIATRHQIYGRYLLPILPFVCILAAIAVVSGVSLLRRFNIPRAPRTALIAGLTIAALLPPAIQAVQFDRTIGRRSTQALAYQWISAKIPRGASIVIEKFDIRLPEQRYRTDHVVRLTDREYDDYVRAGVQYVVASSQVFGPVLDAPQNDPDRYAAYRRLFDQSKELVRIAPTDEHPGPELRVYQLQQ